jgi:flavodoxin
MNTLIIYYSFTRNNELLAKQIQQRLGGQMYKIETLKRRTAFSIFLDLLFKRKPAIRKHQLSLQNYDQIVFIAPVWAGKIAGPLVTFLNEEKRNIHRYSFITLCGGGIGQKEKIEQELISIFSFAPLKVTELWISNLLSDDKKKSINNVSGYRIQSEDWAKYKENLDDFCNVIQVELVK